MTPLKHVSFGLQVMELVTFVNQTMIKIQLLTRLMFALRMQRLP